MGGADDRRPGGRRTAAEAEQSRHRILDAALDLFATRGFDAVGLRDVAGVAEASHGLIRHHFGSKEGVWAAVVDEADRRLVAALGPGFGTVDPDVPVADAVRAVLGPLAVAAAAHPQIVQLLVREATAGGPRLTGILTRIAPLRVATSGLLARLREGDRPPPYDEATFFLLVLTAVVLPFAVDPLVTSVLDARLDPDRHVERLTGLLIG